MAKRNRTSGGFLSMHRNERKASLQLAGVCFLVVIALGIRAYFHQPAEPDPEAVAYFQQRVDAWSEAQALKEANKEASSRQQEEITELPIEVPRFDPNTLDDAGWRYMGLSDKQIKTLRNYQAKGGYFAELNDLRRVYSLGDEFVDRYGKYADFPSPKNEEPRYTDGGNERPAVVTSTPEKSTAPVVKLDINSADSTQLVALRGVGPFYARQILRTRNALGGFAELEQLQEVWKMREETYQALLEQVEIQAAPGCLELNVAKAEELAKHPYVSWNLARSIANYREVNGPFKRAEELRKLHLMEDSVWTRLQPYLCLDDDNR